ncbi:MAG: 4Fe-4S dicluster domain-containing protein [Pyrinomonadaceae bacterium]|nr:4Fe-4S dicluster domain-containing protein [Pyrinomonadaceae bacterium]
MRTDSLKLNESELQSVEGKLLACVHCGLCLDACPTYVETGDENDGPRGRIYLMRAVEEGRLDAASPAFARHIDRCLGCRACESACPAGVEYGQLLEAARADLFANAAQQGWLDRVLRFTLAHVWMRPRLLRALFTSARLTRDLGLVNVLLRSKLPRLLSRRFEFALALLDSSAPAKLHAPTSQPSSDTDVPPARASSRALLFKGCVTEGLFARVNRATVRVLAVNSCRAEAPRAQVCCGALHAHAGDLTGARTLARRNIDAFADEGQDAPIITNAGGCGALLASYAHLLADDPEYAERARQFSARVRDVSQHLTSLGTIESGASVDNGATTYDASCHLLHGQRAADEPLKLLAAIPALGFVPLAGSDRCCGGAGVYNLLHPELSALVLAEKLAHVCETGARALATGNPGCHMQIGAGARLAGMELRVCHPIELLDESYRRAGRYKNANQ